MVCEKVIKSVDATRSTPQPRLHAACTLECAPKKSEPYPEGHCNPEPDVSDASVNQNQRNGKVELEMSKDFFVDKHLCVCVRVCVDDVINARSDVSTAIWVAVGDKPNAQCMNCIQIGGIVEQHCRVAP